MHKSLGFSLATGQKILQIVFVVLLEKAPLIIIIIIIIFITIIIIIISFGKNCEN